jgi:acyl dehydratase
MDGLPNVKVGDIAEFEKKVTQEDIEAFARVSGDTNPLHTDPAYAAKTRFKEPIAHGMLSAGFISAVLSAIPRTAVRIAVLRFLQPVRP